MGSLSATHCSFHSEQHPPAAYICRSAVSSMRRPVSSGSINSERACREFTPPAISRPTRSSPEPVGSDEGQCFLLHRFEGRGRDQRRFEIPVLATPRHPDKPPTWVEQEHGTRYRQARSRC